jgi:hypothetical protein
MGGDHPSDEMSHRAARMLKEVERLEHELEAQLAVATDERSRDALSARYAVLLEAATRLREVQAVAMRLAFRQASLRHALALLEGLGVDSGG